MVYKIRKILYYVPKKYLIKLIFILFIFCCFLITVKAETINSTCSSINQACSTNGRFTYSLYQSAYDTYSTGTFKTTYNGRADYLVFDFDYDLLGNATYSLSISANSTDFRNISKSNVSLESSNDCATPTGYLDITNVSFSKSKIVITFKTVSNTSRFILAIGDPEGPAITGVSTFGISSIDITTVESNDTQNIIDNQNQNANSIIDNANDNTDKIIGSINDNFNNCRPSKNLVDFSSITSSMNFYYVEHNLNYNMESGKTYTLSFDGTSTVEPFAFTVGGGSSDKYLYDIRNIQINNNGNLSITFTPTASHISQGSTLWLRFPRYGTPTSVNYTISNVMLNEGSTALPYEEYGKEICQNKIDETNDKLDNLNGNITNSDVDSGVGSDFFNDFKDEDNGGISGIIKAPLVLINNLLGTTNSCSDLSFPILGKSVSLPCGSLLWAKVPNDILTIYYTIICGYLSFVLLKKLYKDIEDLKNPNDSEVRTTDL